MAKTKRKPKIQISRHAQPFLYKGGKIGVLFIHGYTDSLWQIRHLARELHQKGVTCMGICLPGHGTTPEDLLNFTTSDWLSSTKRALVDLRKFCQKVYVVGVSLGGNLALSLAAKDPNLVDGLICVGTPMFIKNQELFKFLIPIVSKFKKFWPKRIPESKKELCRRVGIYDKFPLKSVLEVIEFVDKNRVEVAKVKIPVLIIHVGEKLYVDPKSYQYLYDNLNSKKKEILKVKDHRGNSTQRTIFKKSCEFLEI
ncbi:MAG: alpha/beta fold hydrolase [Candidatus Aenigmarchaeota archaeon]|nr:alpha/beta fold hydrolase [Candidatus Aenigmarchaeota archaeon]